VIGSLILLGTLTTLVYFHFGVRARPGLPAQRPEWVESLAFVSESLSRSHSECCLPGLFCR
jgi:hypothetical protein